MISLLENSEIVKKVITGYFSIELLDKRENEGGDETIYIICLN